MKGHLASSQWCHEADDTVPISLRTVGVLGEMTTEQHSLSQTEVSSSARKPGLSGGAPWGFRLQGGAEHQKPLQVAKVRQDAPLFVCPSPEPEPEASSELDLGTKIRTPKDIMLEELSLMKNRGSKMFRMRQKRVERFIYENNPDIFTSESMDNLQKFVPSLGGQLGGQMINAGGQLINQQISFGALQFGGSAPVPPPKPGSKGAGVGGVEGAGGEGGKGEGASEWSPLKGGGKDDKKHKLVMKTYVSPWEKAMKGDENLITTMKGQMPGPIKYMELPKYKSFNRIAVPFGGFEKANQFLKFQLPEAEATKQEPEPPVVYQHDIGCRPSFNRTPIGWVGSSEPGSIHMETDAVPFDGETDEL